MKLSQYSMELKSQVLKEIKETGSVAVVAKKHSLNPRTVYNWTRNNKNSAQIAEQRTMRALSKKVEEQALQIEVLKSLLKKRTKSGTTKTNRSRIYFVSGLGS